MTESLSPSCGDIVGFTADTYHGVKAVKKGDRYAIGITVTLVISLVDTLVISLVDTLVISLVLSLVILLVITLPIFTCYYIPYN